MARLSRPLLPMRYTLLFVVAPLPLLIAADFERGQAFARRSLERRRRNGKQGLGWA